jgi:ABC-type nitrate/sulfonate/bicarbonate transport system substrate-binding protein
MLHDRGISRDGYELVVLGGWEQRYTALLERKISATLLTEPFIDKALDAGCHLLARDFEMIPSYQGSCGAAKRDWAAQHGDRLIRYIQAYQEASRFCFDPRNRKTCLDILGRHNDIHGRAAERTLTTLLDPLHGIYPNAALHLDGVMAVLELRADLGYLSRPFAPLEKYIDLSYYQRAAMVPAHHVGEK